MTAREVDGYYSEAFCEVTHEGSWDDVGDVYLGDVRPWRSYSDGTCVLALDGFGGSDYSGDASTAANHEWLWGHVTAEECATCAADVRFTYGGCSSFGAVVRVDGPGAAPRCEELADTLDGLVDYPCVSDDAWSEIEHRWEEEAWNNLYRDDVCRELAEQVGDELADALDPYVDELFGRFVYDGWGNGNEVWVHEGSCATSPGGDASIRGDALELFVEEIVDVLTTVCEFAAKQIRADGARLPLVWHR